MKPLRLKARVQRHLVLAHLAEDDGEFAFVLCRRGLEAAMGRRLKMGERLAIEVSVKEVCEDGHEQGEYAD